MNANPNRSADSKSPHCLKNQSTDLSLPEPNPRAHKNHLVAQWRWSRSRRSTSGWRGTTTPTSRESSKHKRTVDQSTPIILQPTQFHTHQNSIPCSRLLDPAAVKPDLAAAVLPKWLRAVAVVTVRARVLSLIHAWSNASELVVHARSPIPHRCRSPTCWRASSRSSATGPTPTGPARASPSRRGWTPRRRRPPRRPRPC